MVRQFRLVRGLWLQLPIRNLGYQRLVGNLRLVRIQLSVWNLRNQWLVGHQ